MGAVAAGVAGALAVLALAASRRSARWLPARPTGAGARLGRWAVVARNGWPQRGRSRAGDEDRWGVEHVRSSLRAGSSLVGAFEQLARAGGGWSSKAQQVLDDRDPGEVFQAALDRWAHRDPEPAVATLVDALAVAGATGASQAAALDVASDVIEERRTIRSEVRAATGSQRSSALVLVAVPIGFAVVLAVVDGRVRQLYVGDPVGWACLALGTAFDAAGALWLRQLVRSVR